MGCQRQYPNGNNDRESEEDRRRAEELRRENER